MTNLKIILFCFLNENIVSNKDFLTAMFFQKGRVETKAYVFSMGVCIIRRVVFLIIYIFTNTSMKVV